MIAPIQQYVYDAVVTRVVDGDTVDLVIDLGFMIQATHRMRLADINCPEVHGTTREAGLAAAAYTRTALLNRPVLVQSRKADDFGRWLARIWIGEKCINDDLVATGHAVPYRVNQSGV